MTTQSEPVLACSLEFSAMEPRMKRLRRLADTGLQWHHLEGNVLRLAYRAEAAAR
jgi:hypothetical protein